MRYLHSDKPRIILTIVNLADKHLKKFRFRYHHQENLRVSMAKERKRLINEDLVSDVPTTAVNQGKNKQVKTGFMG